MIAHKRTPRLTAELRLEPVQHTAEARAMLLHVAAEIAEYPPTLTNLQDWSKELRRIPPLHPRQQAVLEMLCTAIDGALKRESQHRQVWADYERMLNPGCKLFLKPFASAHCDAKTNARIHADTCQFEKGKPCPFGDYYCVNRFGGPCDHISAALELASRHWRDVAAAESRKQLHRANARCKRLVRKNLSLWIHRITQALFQRARTPLYQAEALVVDALIQPA